MWNIGETDKLREQRLIEAERDRGERDMGERNRLRERRLIETERERGERDRRG